MKTQLLFKLFALVALAGLVLSACAPAATPTPETITVEVTKIVQGTPQIETVVVTATPEEVKPVKLTVWQFGAEGHKRSDDGVPWANWWKRKVEEFSSLNPNIEIEWAMKGQEAGGTTLFIDSAVAAGTPPDIYLDVVFRESKFATQGLLEPVDEVLSADQWAALNPSSVNTVANADGTHWGIPLWEAPPSPLTINKTLAEAAGAGDLLPKDPDRDWTTDEFVAFLQAVTQAPNRYGTMFFAKTPSFDYTLNGYAGAFGASLYTDGNYCQNTINSAEGVEWMEWMVGLIDQGLVFPGPAGLTDDDLDAAWINQQIALAGGGLYYVNLSNRLVSEGTVPALDTYLVNYPHKEGRSTTPLIPNAGWSITMFKQDDPDKRAAAIKLARYIGSQSFTAEFAKGYGWLAPYTEIAKDWAGDDPDRLWIISQIEKNGLQDMGYGITNFTEVRLMWAETRQAIWSGDKPAKEGLDEFVSSANELLCK